jgi:hypothetical protein
MSGACGVLLVLFTAACGTASGDTDRLPVPTFDPSATRAPADPGAPVTTGLPADCTRILTPEDLAALFGLPLGSVAVRTTIGASAPSVGRTERTTCSYTGTGGERGRLLDMVAGRYTDADAAAGHWRINADSEDGQARDLPIGAAPGVLVERPGEAVLLVVNEADSLTLVLPDGVRVGDRSSADLLADLAQRVLPRLAPDGATVTPTPTTVGPAS